MHTVVCVYVVDNVKRFIIAECSGTNYLRISKPISKNSFSLDAMRAPLFDTPN
jgi:hypothetical protein